MNIYQRFKEIKHKPCQSASQLTDSFSLGKFRQESARKKIVESENLRCEKNDRGYVDINCA